MLVAITRTAILYAVVIVAMRFMGKRQIGELEPTELVVAIMISELAAVPMQDPGMSLASGLIPILTLACLEIMVSFILLKSVRMRKLLCGAPCLLIHDGKIIEKELKKNRLTLDELIEDLRLQNILDFGKVQYAVLETNGKISTVLYSEHRPMSTGASGEADRGLPVTLINDGRTMSDNLKMLGLDESWLNKTLKDQGASAASDVFLLTRDEQGGIYYLPKEDTRTQKDSRIQKK